SINVALSCGNDVAATHSGENCDDGNRVSEGPGQCDANCRLQTCPDGVIEGTETCDDNNAGECPSTCIEQACANPDSSAPKTATIQWNAPSAVGSLTVFLDSPESKVELPGSGPFIPDMAQSALTSFPSGTSHQGNDLGNLGWALRVVVTKATAITPRPG